MRLALIVIASGIVVACASQQSSPIPRDSPIWVDPAKVSFSNNLGTSCDDLIVIKGAKTDFEGTGAEVIWLSRAYPGYRNLQSSTSKCKDRIVDVEEIETRDGQRLAVMFDITATFGKM